MTKNGSGRLRVSPSTVTCRSSMTSSSADRVFGEVRLDLVREQKVAEHRAGLVYFVPH